MAATKDVPKMTNIDDVMKGSNIANQKASLQDIAPGKGAGKRPPAPGLGEIKASEDKENRAEKKAKSGATRSDNDKPKGRKRNAEEAGSKVEAVQKPSGKTKKRKAEEKTSKDIDMPGQVEEEKKADSAFVSRSGRSTKTVDYKERSDRMIGQSVAVKEDMTEQCELDALKALQPEAKAFRLTDFELESDDSQHQPLDWSTYSRKPLWVTGVIHKTDGTLTKGSGRRVLHFGPVKTWRMENYVREIQIILTTALAEYKCIKASTTYKKLFTHLTEQAAIAYEVQKALHSDLGGKITCTFDEAVARLSRAKVGKSYESAREALILNGNFVIAQLKEHDKQHATTLTDSPLVVALNKEIKDLERNGTNITGSIVINEGQDSAAHEDKLGSAEKRHLQADTDYARQLQAQMDVQEARGRNRRGALSRQAYIKISEAEIADDYPEPLGYDKPEEETDELLLADDEMFDVDPESLPRRLLSDFSIYNSEGMMSTLELLPMWSGTETDTDLFFSGTVKDDDGEWAGGQTLEGGTEGASSSSGVQTSSGFDMRIFSSQIQEWIVEFGCDRLFITIRTDVAWYRLASPHTKYAPWFEVVLKSARLAVNLMTMLTKEARPSKLSLNDIIKRLAALQESDPVFISKKGDNVQRFVVVHGQIILNQFKNFPNKAVRESAFVSSLKALMEGRRHSKLYFKASKPALRLRSNSNPMRDRASTKAAPMTATATAMVRDIWQSYFPASDKELSGTEEDKEVAIESAKEVDEDLNEEDDEAEEEDALAENVVDAPESAKTAAVSKPIVWEEYGKKIVDGLTFYRTGKIGDLDVSVGDCVTLSGVGNPTGALGLVQSFWVAKDKSSKMQIRTVLRGKETVLGDAASGDELFLTSMHVERPVDNISSKLDVSILRRTWKLSDRRNYLAEDQARHEHNKKAEETGKCLKYILRSLYLPEEGMFCQIPADFELGKTLQIAKANDEETVFTTDGKSISKSGTKYNLGDFVFLRPGVLDHVDGANKTNQPAEYASKGRFHKGGANSGLRAYGIAKITSIPGKSGGQKKEAKNMKVGVQRFYRPEDVSRDHALRADFWEIYASNESTEIDPDDIVSKCKVAGSQDSGDDTFRCIHTFTRSTGEFTDPPENLSQARQKKQTDKGKITADKGKNLASVVETEKATQYNAKSSKRESSAKIDGLSLASMDIFAGCGGLTEGLHQAGAAHAKWAIEYEEPAAQAFRLNHPNAVCWAKNCNVILTAAMMKAGLSDLCVGSKEAEEQAKNMDQETLNSLPAPGQVDFLCGGPPCQGYSGMNRFNKGNWSMVQNSMVMAYLSFADVYRPRYFLLENVRNFVSHNKSFTFRLTLRSLLDMGYQVRFGVLNAGNFGVSQSRKRTFIWAAAPGDLLPDWPKLLHIFRSPQLTINLPGGMKYCAVPQTEGAPLRTVTVRDVISDLPSIKNGHATTEMQYSGPPVSAFQRAIRGEESVLKDHICKEMNALNLERCRCVPKDQPGADWRVLQKIVEEDPSREKFQGQALVPWCLPNTADRHNGWRGLFGRLDWEGHFPTSTTDPQPMGKVGQVFHPSQDRIVSVRECARAQGFPDSFQFYGNVHNKHRQIGNAVPPPLAFNLGKCLRKALEKTAAKKAEAILLAQLA